MMKKISKKLKSQGWLTHFLSIAYAVGIGITTLTMTASLSACDKETPAEAFDKEDKAMQQYWGNDYSYLNGIWVEESNPTGSYTVIEPGRKYKSVNMVVPGRVVNGTMTFYHSETHGVKFDGGNYFSLIWLNDSHTRIEVHSFNPYTEETDPEVAVIWKKVDAIPDGMK